MSHSSRPAIPGRGGYDITELRRPLYAAFLREAAAAPGLRGLEEAAERYDALGRQGDALADTVDPACPHDEHVAMFARMADLLDGLADAEQEAATDLLRTAGDATAPS